MATIKSIEKKIAELNKERDGLNAQLTPLQKKLASLYGRIEKLQNEKDALQLAAAEASDWAWLLEVFPESDSKYKARQKALGELGLMTCGYWTDTQQATVKIALLKAGAVGTRDNAKQLASVKMLLPFIRENDKGFKKLDIFEYTLSEYHSYWLEVYADGRVKVAHCCNYGDSQPTLETIEEAFEYVSQYHWYEGDEEEDEEED